jgi:GAF domain-containing protein
MTLHFFSPAAFPEDEEARQKAVHAARVDRAATQAIVERAAALFDTPIAAASLLEADRQVFVASVGLDVDGTPRSVAFCAHAILDPEQLLCVQDARTDTRFAGNPLVCGGLSIRYYVGAPIVTAEGLPLGALCVIDTRPREAPDAAQRKALKEMAGTIAELWTAG